MFCCLKHVLTNCKTIDLRSYLRNSAHACEIRVRPLVGIVKFMLSVLYVSTLFFYFIKVPSPKDWRSFKSSPNRRGFRWGLRGLGWGLIQVDSSAVILPLNDNRATIKPIQPQVLVVLRIYLLHIFEYNA